jgi:organic hydroperoxide reductase OsmC/OhrA
MEADVTAVEPEVLEHAIKQFESFCIVAQSIRHGIPVHVEL